MYRPFSRLLLRPLRLSRSLLPRNVHSSKPAFFYKSDITSSSRYEWDIVDINAEIQALCGDFQPSDLSQGSQVDIRREGSGECGDDGKIAGSDSRDVQQTIVRARPDDRDAHTVSGSRGAQQTIVRARPDDRDAHTVSGSRGAQQTIVRARPDDRDAHAVSDSRGAQQTVVRARPDDRDAHAVSGNRDAQQTIVRARPDDRDAHAVSDSRNAQQTIVRARPDDRDAHAVSDSRGAQQTVVRARPDDRDAHTVSGSRGAQQTIVMARPDDRDTYVKSLPNLSSLRFLVIYAPSNMSVDSLKQELKKFPLSVDVVPWNFKEGSLAETLAGHEFNAVIVAASPDSISDSAHSILKLCSRSAKVALVYPKADNSGLETTWATCVVSGLGVESGVVASLTGLLLELQGRSSSG